MVGHQLRDRRINAIFVLAAMVNVAVRVDSSPPSSSLSSLQSNAAFPHLAGTGVNVAEMAPYQDQGLANRGGQLVYNAVAASLGACFTRTGGGGTTQATIVSRDAYDFSNSLAVEGGLKIDSGAFKGSVDAAINFQKEKHGSRYFARSTLIHADEAVSFQINCLNDPAIVSPGFLSAVKELAKNTLPPSDYCDDDRAKWEPYFNFIGAWGTHLVTGTVAGSSFDILMSEKRTSSSNSDTISGALGASYEAVSVKGSIKLNNKDAKTTRDQIVRVTVLGGNVTTQMKLAEVANAMLSSPADPNVPLPGLGALMAEWIDSLERDKAEGRVIINAKYLPWENVIPVMRKTLGVDFSRALAGDMARAASTQMKLRWKRDCPRGLWNEESLMCDFKIPQLTERTSNVPNIIVAKTEYVMFNEATFELELIKDKSKASQFLFDESIPSEPRIFLLDAYQNRRGVLFAEEGSQSTFYLGSEDASGVNARFMVTANQGIRLQDSRDFLTVDGSKLVLKRYPFGSNPSSVSVAQFSIERPIGRLMTMNEIMPLMSSTKKILFQSKMGEYYVGPRDEAENRISTNKATMMHMLPVPADFYRPPVDGSAIVFIMYDDNTYLSSDLDGSVKMEKECSVNSVFQIITVDGFVLLRNVHGMFLGVETWMKWYLSGYSTVPLENTLWKMKPYAPLTE